MFKNNKVILIVLLIILAFIGYRFFFNKDVPLGDSSLVVDSSTSESEQSIIGKDMIMALSKLKSLKLDDTFFRDPVFSSLKDFTVPIYPQGVGRTNPFSSFGNSVD